MPIIKYTTQVDARKTVSEIQGILAHHGANRIMVEYDDGQPVALAFELNTARGPCFYRLPTNAGAILQLLRRDDAPRRFQTLEHATRVAWRILKDWVAAQGALVETTMVEAEQVFLPYLLVDHNETLFQRWHSGLALPPGQTNGAGRTEETQ